jgi:hypothetical protein
MLLMPSTRKRVMARRHGIASEITGDDERVK